MVTGASRELSLLSSHSHLLFSLSPVELNQDTEINPSSSPPTLLPQKGRMTLIPGFRSGIYTPSLPLTPPQAIRESARIGDSGSFSCSSSDHSPRKRSGSTTSARHFFSPNSSTVNSSSDIPFPSPPSPAPTQTSLSPPTSAEATPLSPLRTKVQTKLRRLTSHLASNESLQELQRQKHLILLLLLLLLVGIGVAGFHFHSLHTALASSPSSPLSEEVDTSLLSVPSLSTLLLLIGTALCGGLLLLFYLVQHPSAAGLTGSRDSSSPSQVQKED
jgi:hypothetical protein